MRQVIPLVRLNEDPVLESIQKLHDCLHDHVNETRDRFDDIKHDVRGVSERVARVEGAIGTSPEVKPKKPFGLVSQGKAFWGIAVAAAAGAGGYKLIVAMATAAHATLMSLK